VRPLQHVPTKSDDTLTRQKIMQLHIKVVHHAFLPHKKMLMDNTISWLHNAMFLF